MSNEKNVPDTKSKSLIIFGIISGVIAILVLAVVGGLFLGAPKVTPNCEVANTCGQNNTDTSGTPTDNSLTVPSVEKFSVTHDGSNLTAKTTVGLTTVPSGLYVEYSIENDDKRVLAAGLIKGDDIAVDNIILTPGANVITLKLRISNATQYSAWKVAGSETILIGGDNTSNTDAKVNPDYFKTPWALKTDTSEQALSDALTVAFGSLPLTDNTTACYSVMTADVSSGEVFPPRPAHISPYILRHIITPASTKSFTVQYVFCEK